MFTPGGQKWAEADSAAATKGTETLCSIPDVVGSFRLEVQLAHRDGAGKYRI